MKITRDNYEIHFLDYLEGNLDETLVDEFIEFLEQNHDLKEELQLFECVTVPHEETAFSGKDKLYKKDNESSDSIDHSAIAWLEGDLSPEEVTSFEAWMNAHPQNRKTADLYLSTKLIADQTVKYPDKTTLYRQPSINAWFIKSARVAAVLLVAMAIWGLWPDDLSELGVDQAIVQTIPVPETTSPTDVMTEAQGKEITSEKSEQLLSDQNLAKNQEFQSDSPVSKPVQPLKTESDIAERVPVELDKLPTREVLLASVESEPVLNDFNLKTAIIQNDEVAENLPVQEKIASRLGVNNFTFSKLVKSGLQVASTISNSRISYETDMAGEVVALSLDTRVLGLHIPVGKE